MEKKTMGGFIATLRKANGMTQKDLAERLNVSDKTVSRWERDEGYPDLSLIPVIAEIFGVTSDELLRGEKKAPDAAPADAPSPRGEKQRQRMLAIAQNQYRNRTYIAMGLSALGLIVAAICNVAFLRSLLGFWLGAALDLASLICQAIFWNNAMLSVSEAEDPEDPAIYRWKQSIIRLTRQALGVTVGLFGFSLPLLLGDSYTGIVDGWLLLGALGAGGCLLIYGVVLYGINGRMLRRGACHLSEKEAGAYVHNRLWKKYCALGLLAVMAVTAVAHGLLTQLYGPMSCMKGAVYEDYESFIALMETEVSVEDIWDHYVQGQAAPLPVEGTAIYYDAHGRIISETEALTRTLEDINGEVVCKYIQRNESIVHISYLPKDGTVLPITAYTQQDLDAARDRIELRHGLFIILYIIEILIAVAIYLKKRGR